MAQNVVSQQGVTAEAFVDLQAGRLELMLPEL